MISMSLYLLRLYRMSHCFTISEVLSGKRIRMAEGYEREWEKGVEVGNHEIVME